MLYPSGEYSMRRINKLFLTGCGYAVLILTLFYIFAVVSKFVTQTIAPGQFALIVLFSFVISFAEFMYEILKVKKIYKMLIHYAVLLTVFYIVFVISGNISVQRPAAPFVAVIIFTILYFAIWIIVHFVRKGINKADDKLESKIKTKEKSQKSKEKYKPLYGDDQ